MCGYTEYNIYVEDGTSTPTKKGMNMLTHIKKFIASHRFSAQGCRTGSRPRNAEAITAVVAAIRADDVTQSHVDYAEDMVEAIAAEAIAAEAIRAAGLEAAEEAGLDTDGYSVEIFWW